MTNARFYENLADLVLIVHFVFVLFVLLGLFAIWTGRWLGWAWVRNFWFRLAHLLAIGVVVAESVGGVVCPLTTWEDKLRRLAGGGEQYAGSFIQHWVHRVMFFEADEFTFTILYLVFFIAVLASLWMVKPRWPARRSAANGRLTLYLVPFVAALSGAAAEVPSLQRTAPSAGIRISAQDRERLELGSTRRATQIESLRAQAGTGLSTTSDRLRDEV